MDWVNREHPGMPGGSLLMTELRRGEAAYMTWVVSSLRQLEYSVGKAACAGRGWRHGNLSFALRTGYARPRKVKGRGRK